MHSLDDVLHVAVVERYRSPHVEVLRNDVKTKECMYCDLQFASFLRFARFGVTFTVLADVGFELNPVAVLF